MGASDGEFARGVDATVVLLPGLGADGRLFGAQKRAFPGLRVLERMEPEGRESLAAYAARLAERFEEPEGPYILGGSSMGGMVALEMARLLRPSAVVLIGSALSGGEVWGWLRAVERAARPLPGGAIEVGRWLTPLGAPLFCSAGRENRGLFLDMLAGTPTGFIRWASRAVTAWRPETLPVAPIHRIHGSRDIIIRPPRESAGVIIRGAGHLLSLSHAEETNAWLGDIVDGLGAVGRVRPVLPSVAPSGGRRGP